MSDMSWHLIRMWTQPRLFVHRLYVACMSIKSHWLFTLNCPQRDPKVKTFMVRAIFLHSGSVRCRFNACLPIRASAQISRLSAILQMSDLSISVHHAVSHWFPFKEGKASRSVFHFTHDNGVQSQRDYKVSPFTSTNWIFIFKLTTGIFPVYDYIETNDVTTHFEGFWLVAFQSGIVTTYPVTLGESFSFRQTGASVSETQGIVTALITYQHYSPPLSHNCHLPHHSDLTYCNITNWLIVHSYKQHKKLTPAGLIHIKKTTIIWLETIINKFYNAPSQSLAHIEIQRQFVDLLVIWITNPHPGPASWTTLFI